MFRRIAMLIAITLVGSLVWLAPAAGLDESDAVRLHLGSDGTRFSYGTATQAITQGSNRCDIASPAGSLITLQGLRKSNGGSLPAGVVGANGIGVKSSGSNANGSPCAQIDATEILRIAPGSSLTGRRFVGVRLDIEMTGNALVEVRFVGATTETYRLQTGTSITSDQSGESGYDTTAPYDVSSGPGDQVDACAAPNSSGPNNGGNDNCLWVIDPSGSFDSVTVTTTIGTVSLEGSGDFSNSPARDSLFYLGNSAPDAVDDSVSTNEDTSTAVNVKANDQDPDGNTLTVTNVGTASKGVASLTNGVVTYDPNGEFETLGTGDTATATFTYTIGDGKGGSDSATVTVTITGVNDKPIAKNPEEDTPEDTAITIDVADDVDSSIINVDCGDTDPQTPPNPPQGGQTAQGGTWTNLGNGDVTYTPALNFVGTETLTCTVTDDEGATSVVQAEVTVGVDAVNDPPNAVADEAETDQDEAVVINVLGNDTDVDPDTLSVSGVTQGANGTVVNNGVDVTYTPNPGYIGSDSFTYTVSDGQGGSDTGMVTVTVFQTICTGDEVDFESPSGLVNGTITKINGTGEVICKRYVLEATDRVGDDDATVMFVPTSSSAVQVKYRMYLEFGPKTAPTLTGSSSNSFKELLEYDPDSSGPLNFRPVQWCEAPDLDGDGNVTDATMPSGESWCIASAFTRGAAGPGARLITTWQIFGIDDPVLRSRPST